MEGLMQGVQIKE